MRLARRGGLRVLARVDVAAGQAPAVPVDAGVAVAQPRQQPAAGVDEQDPAIRAQRSVTRVRPESAARPPGCQTGLPGGFPPVGVGLVGLGEDGRRVVAGPPVGVVGLEPFQVADPPDVVTDPAGVPVAGHRPVPVIFSASATASIGLVWVYRPPPVLHTCPDGGRRPRAPKVSPAAVCAPPPRARGSRAMGWSEVTEC